MRKGGGLVISPTALNYADAIKQTKALAHAARNHDKLVEALEGLINDIDINHHIKLDNTIGGSTREALAVAQEALKQAKGGE